LSAPSAATQAARGFLRDDHRQPVGEIYCAYLPAALSWIAEPLAQVVGRAPFSLDCATWLSTVNIQLGEGVTAPGQHWLGALSLVAELPGPKPAKDPKDNDVYQGPWHLDCRLSGNLPSNDLSAAASWLTPLPPRWPSAP